MHYIAMIFGSDQHQVLCNKEILGVGALCLLQCHHGWIPEAAELTTCKKVLIIDGQLLTQIIARQPAINPDFVRMVVGVRQGYPAFVQWLFS